MEGTIRKLKNGYGFIAGSDGVDYFFHWTDLLKTSKQFRNLSEGEKCEFNPEKNEKGPRAGKIVIGSTVFEEKGV